MWDGGGGEWHPGHSSGVIAFLTLVACGLYILIRGLYDGLRK